MSFFVPLRRRLLATVGILLAGSTLALTACGGDKSPLADALTPVQLDQFDRSMVTGMELSLGTGPIEARIDAYEASCAALDQSVPMLAVTATQCPAVVEVHALTAVLDARCADLVPACARAMTRLGNGLATFARLLPESDAAVRKVVSDDACLKQLTGYPGEAAVYAKMSTAAFEMVKAVDAGNNADFVLAADRFAAIPVDAMPADVAELRGRPIADQLAAYREACKVDA